MYLLFRGKDDSQEPVILDAAKLSQLLNNPEDWGVRRFLKQDDITTLDVNYWPDGAALLMSATVLVPEAVTVAYRLP